MAVLSDDARAQGTGSNSKVITWKPANSGEIYVGILGEIARPGVYRLDAPSLTLQSVIRRSGGLTDEASGTIRVIRQDRIVESAFFSPQSNSPLLAGDLLVVESKRTQAAISKMYDADPRLRSLYEKAAEVAVRGSDPSGVQVAFVNVLDRPVIVKIKHENARLSHVVQMLDQPVELALAVRVIGPERLLTQTASTQPAQASLADGSVLIFPANAINRNKLPVLPIPYDSEIAHGATPSLIGGPSGQSAELRNVGQLPPQVYRNSRDSIPTALPQDAMDHARIPSPPPSNPTIPSASERVELPPPSNQTPLVGTRPRIANLPYTGQASISSSSQLSNEPDSEPNQPAAPDRNPANTPSTGQSAPESTDAAKDRPGRRSSILEEDGSLDETDPDSTEPAKTSSFSLGHMLGIVTCVGLLIGLAMLTRRHFDRRAIDAGGSESQFEPGMQLTEMQQGVMQPTDTPAWDAMPLETANSEAETVNSHANDAGGGQELFLEVAPPTELHATEPVDNRNTDDDSRLAPLWFDQLLANSLPVCEEDPVFPAQILLQGKIVAPPVYRLDEAVSQPLAHGPHFAVSPTTEPSDIPVTSRSEPVGEVTSGSEPVEEQIIDEVDSAHGRRPGKPHFLRRRVGAQTVASAAGSAAQSGTIGPPGASEVKHSITPVTDALRHLQGGQS
jgi:hypothetical protein